MKYTLMLTVIVWATFLILVTACGPTIKGGTTHEIKGDATVHVDIDVPLCSKLPEDQQAACIEKVLAVLDQKKEVAAVPVTVNQ